MYQIFKYRHSPKGIPKMLMCPGSIYGYYWEFDAIWLTVGEFEQKYPIPFYTMMEIMVEVETQENCSFVIWWLFTACEGIKLFLLMNTHPGGNCHYVISGLLWSETLTLRGHWSNSQVQNDVEQCFYTMTRSQGALVLEFSSHVLAAVFRSWLSGFLVVL